MVAPRSHGTGEFRPEQFRRLGRGVVFERGVLVFHPENIEIGDEVYVGHNAILKGYYRGTMCIGDRSWVGQGAFLHSAGDVIIGRRVGIGPGVHIITSVHCDRGPEVPWMDGALEFAPVTIGDGADIGAGAVLLPGARVGRLALVGAGAVVTGEIPDGAIAVGVPARFLRYREGWLHR